MKNARRRLKNPQKNRKIIDSARQDAGISENVPAARQNTAKNSTIL